MRKLTVEHVIALHKAIVMKTGGNDGIRDEGLLDSAVNAPFQSFGGYDMYTSLVEKAARLGFGLAQNHAFIDGNKRIGTHAMLTFFDRNNVQIKYDAKDLIGEIFGVADGSVTYEDFLNWLEAHIQNEN